LRGVPRRGLGYGVLEYLSTEPNVRAGLKGLCEADVSFNYLGQLDQVVEESVLWGGAGEANGPIQSEKGKRSHLLEINGLVAGGQLRLSWTYSGTTHRRETIEQVASQYVDRLRDLIGHCQMAEAGGYTPSDFPEVSLSQAELDDLLTQLQ